MSTRVSEILLFAILLIILGLTRVYYGMAGVPMFVWKGDFGFKDTFVNLPEFERLPAPLATKEHPAVLFQLEEMGLLDFSSDLPRRPSHSRGHALRSREAAPSVGTPAAAVHVAGSPAGAGASNAPCAKNNAGNDSKSGTQSR